MALSRDRLKQASKTSYGEARRDEPEVRQTHEGGGDIHTLIGSGRLVKRVQVALGRTVRK